MFSGRSGFKRLICNGIGMV
uniref:Uncharacterized protein n=1 Tax=Arundo donax TaxID=35708 RepID=A0A0A9HLN5_ARUDO